MGSRWARSGRGWPQSRQLTKSLDRCGAPHVTQYHAARCRGLAGSPFHPVGRFAPWPACCPPDCEEEPPPTKTHGFGACPARFLTR
eukprot:6381055-Alexandrium_andersonii.AAC.1